MMQVAKIDPPLSYWLEDGHEELRGILHVRLNCGVLGICIVRCRAVRVKLLVRIANERRAD
jgi:hypothetical protein